VLNMTEDNKQFNILVAEHSQNKRTGLARPLAEQDYSITSVDSLEGILQAVKDKHFDKLVFNIPTDYNTWDDFSFDLSRTDLDIPVIVIGKEDTAVSNYFVTRKQQYQIVHYIGMTDNLVGNLLEHLEYYLILEMDIVDAEVPMEFEEMPEVPDEEEESETEDTEEEQELNVTPTSGDDPTGAVSLLDYSYTILGPDLVEVNTITYQVQNINTGPMDIELLLYIYDESDDESKKGLVRDQIAVGVLGFGESKTETVDVSAYYRGELDSEKVFRITMIGYLSDQSYNLGFSTTQILFE
jgi:CheY-like chemotaxis protein